jgi:hypothetical protein
MVCTEKRVRARVAMSGTNEKTKMKKVLMEKIVR